MISKMRSLVRVQDILQGRAAQPEVVKVALSLCSSDAQLRHSREPSFGGRLRQVSAPRVAVLERGQRALGPAERLGRRLVTSGLLRARSPAHVVGGSGLGVRTSGAAGDALRERQIELRLRKLRRRWRRL
jgi:hypothetical protein